MRLRNTGKRSGQKEIWYSEAPPRVDKATNQIVIKTWQKLPSMLLEEWCKKKRRPQPLFLQAKSVQENVVRFRVILPDPNDDRSCDLVFCPFESKLKTKKAVVAKEEAALVAFFSIFTSPELALAGRAEDDVKEVLKFWILFFSRFSFRSVEVDLHLVVAGGEL